MQRIWLNVRTPLPLSPCLFRRVWGRSIFDHAMEDVSCFAFSAYTDDDLIGLRTSLHA